MQMGPRRGEGEVLRGTRIVAEPRARILAQPERRPLPRRPCRCRRTDLVPFDRGWGAAKAGLCTKRTYHFKDMLNKVKPQTLRRRVPALELAPGRRQQQRQAVLENYYDKAVSMLYAQMAVHSRRPQARSRRPQDREGLRQDLQFRT